MADVVSIKPLEVLETPELTKNRAVVNFRLKTESLIADAKALIDLPKNLYANAQENYKIFKKTNNLYIDPQYETSSLFALGALSLMSMGESGATSFLLKNISNGLAGAIFLALSLSIANVLLGFCIGWLLVRYMRHNDRFHRVWASLLFFPITIGGVWYNLTIGIFRENAEHAKLDSATAQNIALAAKQVWPAITGFFSGQQDRSLSTPSLVLVILGLAIFFLSMYKGIFQDHPYPEFKKQFESLRRAEESYFTLRSTIYNESSQLIDALNVDITAEGSKHSNDMQAYLDALISWHTEKVDGVVYVEPYVASGEINVVQA